MRFIVDKTYAVRLLYQTHTTDLECSKMSDQNRQHKQNGPRTGSIFLMVFVLAVFGIATLWLAAMMTAHYLHDFMPGLFLLVISIIAAAMIMPRFYGRLERRFPPESTVDRAFNICLAFNGAATLVLLASLCVPLAQRLYTFFM